MTRLNDDQDLNKVQKEKTNNNKQGSDDKPLKSRKSLAIKLVPQFDGLLDESAEGRDITHLKLAERRCFKINTPSTCEEKQNSLTLPKKLPSKGLAYFAVAKGENSLKTTKPRDSEDSGDHHKEIIGIPKPVFKCLSLKNNPFAWHRGSENRNIYDYVEARSQKHHPDRGFYPRSDFNPNNSDRNYQSRSMFRQSQSVRDCCPRSQFGRMVTVRSSSLESVILDLMSELDYESLQVVKRAIRSQFDKLDREKFLEYFSRY